MSVYEEGTLSNTAAITAGSTWSVPIPASVIANGPLNEIFVALLDTAAENLKVYITGANKDFYYPLGSGGSINIEKKDKKYYTIVKVENISATDVAIGECIVTYRRVV